MGPGEVTLLVFLDFLVEFLFPVFFNPSPNSSTRLPKNIEDFKYLHVILAQGPC